MVTGCSALAAAASPAGSAIWLASSSDVSAARASPPAMVTISRMASSSSSNAPASPLSSASARRTIFSMDASSRCSSSTTRDLLMSAEFTSK